ncbi:hypothetical protein NIES37_03060 [Tolypothrix tenuis PCC 7101]|uniref:Uncharacterized protein n=1 Tax=Tolypothrix tenuis PCC 7101 TaxID=231146 RepID=A0A1Z4MSD6_9CYAN|nr:hypothetical protein [Aulosira sp. FACHB-113]BAY96374.1 hypothetical protein NIES37_03060 [Tolypothrix tenuis PCC 7101]BAZ73119.1 hypothetical protein NIES50_16780 [Aulosira laxa NIES-50]
MAFENKLLGIGHWGIGHREKAEGQGAGSRGKITNTNYQLPITNYQLPITQFPIPVLLLTKKALLKR